MTTSQTQVAQALSETPIKKFWFGYFQEHYRETIHQELLEVFEQLRRTKGFTKADLAQKMDRRPEQVTRWLSAPTNLEADTISDIGLAMGVAPVLRFEPVESLLSTSKSNHEHDVSRRIANSARAEFHAQATPLKASFTPSDTSAVHSAAVAFHSSM